MPGRRLILLVGGALALAGCGGSDDGGGGAAAATPTPGATPPAPLASLDFARGPDGIDPASPAEAVAGALRLEAGAEPVRAPLTRTVPGDQAVQIVATVRGLRSLPGRAGVFCRGSGDGRSGYELTIDRRERLRLERVQDGRRTLVAGFDADLGEPTREDAPVPLLLTCGSDGSAGGVALAASAGVRQPTPVRDPGGRPAPGPGRVGLVAGGPEGSRADFAGLVLSAGR